MSNIPEHAKKVFSGLIFDVYHWEQELFDGTTTTFEALKRKGTAVVLPILDNGNFLMCIQEQPGYSKRLDFLGGRQDNDEDLLETAKRELLEESGYEAELYDLLLEKNPWTPKVEWPIHYYIAKGLTKVSEQKLDA
jgi:ADP-ribose pyrophosphatase